MIKFKQFLLESVVDQVKKKYETDYDKHGRRLLLAAQNDEPMIDHIYQNTPVEYGNFSYRHSAMVDVNRKEVEAGKPSLHSHIIDKLSEGDPSKDKKHLPMIAHWYSQRNFRTEDLGSAETHAEHPNWNTVHGTLKAFSDIKNKDLLPDIEHPDPNKARAGQKLKGTRISSYAHMTWPQFRAHVHKHLGLDKAMAGSLDEHPGIEKINEHEGTKLYRVKTEAGAKHANKVLGAKWCTGWEGHDNMFDSYNDDGPIYIAHHADGNVHQIHLESGQFMDKNDEEVDLDHLAKNYPGVKKIPNIKHQQSDNGKLPFLEDHEKHAYVESHLNKIDRHGEVNPDHIGPHNSVDSMSIVAHNGDHEQIKALSNVTRTGALHNIVQARRLLEFNEPLHSVVNIPNLLHKNIERGTPEHLEHLFTAHEHLKKIQNYNWGKPEIRDKLEGKIIELTHNEHLPYYENTSYNIDNAKSWGVTHFLHTHLQTPSTYNPSIKEIAQSYHEYHNLSDDDKKKYGYIK